MLAIFIYTLSLHDFAIAKDEKIMTLFHVGFLQTGLLLQVEVFLNWSVQLAEAGKFLSQNGVVHRDMKLDNVLVSRDGVFKVCDFGFALQAQPSNLTTCIKRYDGPGGNPAHLAPEVLTAARRAAAGEPVVDQ